MSRIPLSVPSFKGNEWQYVKECLDTEWVSSAGKYVDLFEQKIAEYTGSKYAVA
ncbi:MAG: aminotransferase DegT, partial [Candidatus Marinimicrobia bacterium]|nr:aminotransferase DegT [Candidatus Neomarinimicrobiota bacterium]